VGAFLAFSLPPYLAFDPARSRVPQPDGFPARYWFLVAHVIFGSVAMVGAVLQVWPWLRRTHPVLHRRIGRVYSAGCTRRSRSSRSARTTPARRR
jgi:hypothetical protein